MRGFLGSRIFGPIAAALDGADTELRAELAGAQLVGLALARYIVKVEPLASADDETVIAQVAPTLQRYLVGG